MHALAVLLAGAFPGVTWCGFSHTLEQAASPASYPTTSTRRLMNPTADARTGRKAYADCRRDCRNLKSNAQE